MRFSKKLILALIALGAAQAEKICCLKGSTNCVLPKNFLAAASSTVPTAAATSSSKPSSTEESKSKSSGSKGSWDGATAFAPQNCPGTGVLLSNMGDKPTTIKFFENLANGNGWGVPDFNYAKYSASLESGETKYLPLPLTFKGRAQRGMELPATWVEFQLDDGKGESWGDVSLQKGYDGAATIHSTDGSGLIGGFTEDIFEGAPPEAYRMKPSGERALDGTSGFWWGPGNKASEAHFNKLVGTHKAYVIGEKGDGTPGVVDFNNCLGITFY
jgi:hypothetical protein